MLWILCNGGAALRSLPAVQAARESARRTQCLNNYKQLVMAIRNGDWKLLLNADGSAAELYNLATDPAETKNVAAAELEITQRLMDQALAWRKSLP